MKTALTHGQRPLSTSAARVPSAVESLRGAGRWTGSVRVIVAFLLALSLPCDASRADVVQLAEPVRTSTWAGPTVLEPVSEIRIWARAEGPSGEALPAVDAAAAQVDPSDDDLKPLCQLTIDTTPKPGEMPVDLAVAKFAQAGQVSHLLGTNRPWNSYAFWWESPALCHQSLYFEEVNLERYGYSYGVAQPLVSAAHFFGTVPALPYLMGATPPRECVYTLGHYLPGSCAPYHIYYPPLSLKGAAVEAGVVTGLFFALP